MGKEKLTKWGSKISEGITDIVKRSKTDSGYRDNREVQGQKEPESIGTKLTDGLKNLGVR